MKKQKTVVFRQGEEEARKSKTAPRTFIYAPRCVGGRNTNQNKCPERRDDRMP
jgi:hypothetical protein